MKYPIYLLAGICLALLTVVYNGQAQGLSVAPARLFLTGVPGQTVTDQLALYNSGNVPVTFNIALKDWNRDSLGNKVYFEPATLPASNANWIEFSPETVTIQPGGKTVVNVEMHIPSTGDPKVTNSMIFLTQVKEAPYTGQKDNVNRMGISIKIQLGVHVYHTPPTFTKKNLEFTSFTDRGMIPAEKDTVRRLALKIKNSGEVVTDAQVRFEITDKDNGEELPVQTQAISMLPNADQILFLDMPAHMKGKHYLAIAFLDSGAATSLKVAEKEIKYDH